MRVFWRIIIQRAVKKKKTMNIWVSTICILQFVENSYGQIGSGGRSSPPINLVKLNCDGVFCVVGLFGIIKVTLFKLFIGDWNFVLFLKQNFGQYFLFWEWRRKPAARRLF